MEYEVVVDGVANGGTVQKINGVWRWFRPNGSQERYTAKTHMADVRNHIARLLFPAVRPLDEATVAKIVFKKI